MKHSIVVTGGAGLVGRAFSRVAVAHGAQVTSVDLVPSPVTGVHSEVADILSSELAAICHRARATAVVHLAARVDPPSRREREQMRRLHIDGTRNAVAAATESGATRFVLASSSVVYGAHADNPIPLTENSPRRPREDFPYAIDKAAQEDVVDNDAGTLSVAYIRPAVIYAKDARNYLTEMLRHAPGILPKVDGRKPPLQFIHAADVASALWRLILHPEATGPFNIGSDIIAYDEVARIARLRPLSLPRRLLAPAANFGARLVPATLRAPSYVLDQLAFPFVVDSRRMQRETGWRASVSSAEALVEMLGR